MLPFFSNLFATEVINGYWKNGNKLRRDKMLKMVIRAVIIFPDLNICLESYKLFVGVK